MGVYPRPMTSLLIQTYHDIISTSHSIKAELLWVEIFAGYDILLWVWYWRAGLHCFGSVKVSATSSSMIFLRSSFNFSVLLCSSTSAIVSYSSILLVPSYCSSPLPPPLISTFRSSSKPDLKFRNCFSNSSSRSLIAALDLYPSMGLDIFFVVVESRNFKKKLWSPREERFSVGPALIN